MSDVYDKIGALDLTSHLIRKDWLFASIDMHTCGEPLRVILSGVAMLQGHSVLARRHELSSNYDQMRKLLMFEPRGHRDMYGCILVEPDSPDADFGIIFIHNEGYSTMCGHAIIAITKLAAELGWKELVDNRLTLKIDTPCGLIISKIDLLSTSDFAIEFEGVPSFVLLADQSINLPGYRPIVYDIAYGGAFYAYVDADRLGLNLSPENMTQIVQLGRLLKREIIAGTGSSITHPKERELSFLYGVIFSSESTADNCDFINVCVFADGEVDRSPTGSGVCGLLALLRHKRKIGIQQELVVESIIHTKFMGSISSEMKYEGLNAVVPLVAGNAFITGQHYFYLDPADAMKEGFLIG
ncbi:MAG: proline racemase family protein [Saprospiraceae bacterium]|nr:proline racemase family protein [Saprospiraceae bacterium]